MAGEQPIDPREQLSELAKQIDLFVGQLSHRCAKGLEVVSGARIGLGQAAIEHLDDLISHVSQALGEEGHKHRIAACSRGALERLGKGLEVFSAHLTIAQMDLGREPGGPGA
jgi:hypothetical protein